MYNVCKLFALGDFSDWGNNLVQKYVIKGCFIKKNEKNLGVYTLGFFGGGGGVKSTIAQTHVKPKMCKPKYTLKISQMNRFKFPWNLMIVYTAICTRLRKSVLKKNNPPPNRRDNPPDCTYLGASRLSFNKCLTRQTNATYTQDNFTVVN